MTTVNRFQLIFGDNQFHAAGGNRVKEGQALIEYALIVSLIGVIAVLQAP